MPEITEGFIVHAFYQSNRQGVRLCFLGRLKNGQTFAAIDDRARPGFHIRISDRDKLREWSRTAGCEESPMRTMDGEACCRLSLENPGQAQTARDELASRGIRTYEADLRFQDQYLILRGIHGSVTIEGAFRPGKHVNRVYVNPELGPSEWQPALSVLSLDIETDLDNGGILAIGLVFRSPWNPKGSGGLNGRTQPLQEQALFLGQIDESRRGDTVRTFSDERSMLQAFQELLDRWDPDIITGWNVVDFDLRVISERFASHKLALLLGRSDRTDSFLSRERGLGSRMIIHGRQVLDGVRLVRAGPESFSDYSLETVATAVLGYGKDLQSTSADDKLRELRRLYREDPAAFCRYCVRDARLAFEIMEKTGLIDLTVQRCRLIGIGMERAWTSVAAFDFIYIEALHGRGIVAPTLGVDSLPLTSAPGGAILKPHPGLYDNVLVFDFKSLYPSIIRTFNIDPLSRLPSKRHPASEHHPAEENPIPPGTETTQGGPILAPNGAHFSREPAILPGLLDRFFHNRALAKERNDRVASFVYKIIMNSFYGVLGTPGCRFAASELAGAITSFGQHILRWCEESLRSRGLQVLYGDTDSLFVLSGSAPDTAPERIHRQGREICSQINAELRTYIRETYNVESKLELELEKLYTRFFLPSVRGAAKADNSGAAGPARGRAKGYAGLVLLPGETPRGGGLNMEGLNLEIVGMEAIRRDWTLLAREFQIKMLEMVFLKNSLETIQAHINHTIQELRAGHLDRKLVYVKALRKPAEEYTKTQPPHVKAAAQLEREQRHGLISFLWTKAGPQPAGRITAPIDYDHYVEKQLKPIASAFTEVLTTDVEHLINGNRQLWLF